MKHEPLAPSQSRGTIWVLVQGVLFVFFALALVMGERLDDFGGLVYLRSAGLLIALLGSFVSIWALRSFGSRVSPFPKPVEGATLIERGPYRFVRHPMYSGIIAFTFGAGLAYASPAAMLSGPLFLVFFLAKTGREEEMLVESVAGYRAYRSRVHWRLIPWVI